MTGNAASAGGTVVERPSGARSFWLALLALCLCGPWPGWAPAPFAVAALVAGLLLLARPRGRSWWTWLPVGVAVLAVALPPRAEVDPDRLGRQLDAHCRGMLALAEEVAGDPQLQRVFAASGEALEPGLPFQVLAQRLRSAPGRTLYLADDRGRVVAFAGEEQEYPRGLRPIGERWLGLVWSAASGTLLLREPLLLEGRLVGSVTVADRSRLSASSAWAMGAPVGCRLVLGRRVSGSQTVHAGSWPGVELLVGCEPIPLSRAPSLPWLAWVLAALVGLFLFPGAAPLVVAIGAAAYWLAPGRVSPTGLSLIVLLAAIAVARATRRLEPRPARLLVVGSLSAAALGSVLWAGAVSTAWLPTHLLRPGWGGIWMLATSWVLSAWPAGKRADKLTLDNRLVMAAVLAGLALVVEVGRLPVQLAAAVEDRFPGRQGTALPRGAVDLGDMLPEAPELARLDDLPLALARRWRLDHWQTPSQLLLVAADGREIGRWGDLAAAGEAVRRLRSFSLEAPVEASVELWVATEPWSLLHDWRTGEPAEASWQGPIWFAALTRSGSVSATLHQQIRDLDPASAGDLYHAGGGWTWLRVGDSTRLAHVRRRGEWLLAAVAHYPTPPVWAVQVALAGLWALFGMAIAVPPTLRRAQLSTLGGRLRLLVAVGVVLPLVLLTVLLHSRLKQEERQLEQVMGLDALRAGRQIGTQLATAVTVNDDLARWLARLVGGEVVLFDGARVAAVSRPDLQLTGVLPQLPVPGALASFLLGRDEPIVVRQHDRLVAAAPLALEGNRLLMHVVPGDPLRSGEAPEAVDWLLTGAILAALVALVLTARVERRLSSSLSNLVALARRLQQGEAMGELPRPPETDIAEVLAAVRSMNEEVRQRELSLRSQEELLRITLSTLSPAVLVLDTAGEVRFCNPSAERLLAEHREQVLSSVADLANRISPDAPQTSVVQPLPGQELTWRVGVARVPLPEGEGLVAVVDDITEVVRADRLRQLNQLARIVAHEVKNPLTPIRLWMQELEAARLRGAAELDELVAEGSREIALQVERLQDTASSFSNLVALERWEAEPVDMADVAEEGVRGLKVLQRRGIRLVSELPAAGTAMVVGDRQWLRRALDNLIKNSLDALGDKPGEIFLRVQVVEGTVVVEVEDTAGGVPSEQIADLFSPHFSTSSGGSGLGLALVHQIVARCHGRVSALSAARGLLVRLELPKA